MSKTNSELPVVVIGAGPVGLAAAANLVERGVDFLLLESGSRVAASMMDWGHVRFFTQWSYLIDPAGERLLEKAGGWAAPDPERVPLAREFVEGFLDRVAALPAVEAKLRLDHRVVSITREGHDRLRDGREISRNAFPFLVVAETPQGQERIRARAVIDATGTWHTPNPMGAAGIPAEGEARFGEAIRYGMPDLLGAERERYAGKRVLVVGSGHSAIGSVLDLTELAKQEPETLIAWGVRGENPAKLWGGGKKDQLKARGALGTRVHEAVHSGAVTLMTGLSIAALREHPEGILVVNVEGQGQVVVDEIIVATGSRPDLSMLRELRLEFDLPTEASKTLGPLIDPNHHSCGSVPPHGAKELAHPEPDFYIVGMKAYGRAPTFLLRTGYEQVRSVVAKLDGDEEAAARVELVLPQTGVCSTDYGYGGSGTPSGCC